MTSFSPGHRPPQVAMPTRHFEGSKKIFRRGPAGSNPGNCSTGTPARRWRWPCRRTARGRSRRRCGAQPPAGQKGHQRRIDAARAKRLDGKVGGINHRRSLPGDAPCRCALSLGPRVARLRARSKYRTKPPFSPRNADIVERLSFLWAIAAERRGSGTLCTWACPLDAGQPVLQKTLHLA